nr:hypothetical protein [Tanacetum cinerariifolium]
VRFYKRKGCLFGVAAAATRVWLGLFYCRTAEGGVFAGSTAAMKGGVRLAAIAPEGGVRLAAIAPEGAFGLGSAAIVGVFGSCLLIKACLFRVCY